MNPFFEKLSKINLRLSRFRSEPGVPVVICRRLAAVIKIQNHTLVLNQGEWSRWINVEYTFKTSSLIPDKRVSGICRFYLQEVSPNFRLYVTPVNADPFEPAIKLTEPADFSRKLADKLGLFYPTGFQEDHKALSRKIFTDDEFMNQADYVLGERLNLLQYALEKYEDGLLFFYFSSTDMQAHMFWWDNDEEHPTRSPSEAKRCFHHLKDIYRRMDAVVGGLLKRYGDKAHLIVMSDNGFSNFKRQFNLNTWLRDNGYLGPVDAGSVLRDVDWSTSRAYGLGLNGLYLNLRGREHLGMPSTSRPTVARS